MIALFDALGIGQWFRYVTGSLEVLGALLLVVPGKTAFGAVLLACHGWSRRGSTSPCSTPRLPRPLSSSP